MSHHDQYNTSNMYYLKDALSLSLYVKWQSHHLIESMLGEALITKDNDVIERPYINLLR